MIVKCFFAPVPTHKIALITSTRRKHDKKKQRRVHLESRDEANRRT